MTVESIRKRLHSLGTPAAAQGALRFFKSDHAAGDTFLGVRAPDLRRLARECRGLSPDGTLKLLQSPIHDERALALVILADRSMRGDAAMKKQVYDLYLANTRHVNNWDLVDVSASPIVGGYLADRSRRPLMKLAKSSDLWERRIAIVATHHFIRRGDLADALAVAERLLSDREDLIHKAVGWTLREIGKRDLPALEGFLRTHCRVMPRTMLRYAIERLPPEARRAYLAGTV
jgi:3-methyladenine DNA glycosylase AlkD